MMDDPSFETLRRIQDGGQSVLGEQDIVAPLIHRCLVGEADGKLFLTEAGAALLAGEKRWRNAIPDQELYHPADADGVKA